MDDASDHDDGRSDDTQRGVLGDMLGTHMEAVLLSRGCECGCCEPGLNPDMLGKLTALVRERRVVRFPVVLRAVLYVSFYALTRLPSFKTRPFYHRNNHSKHP